MSIFLYRENYFVFFDVMNKKITFTVNTKQLEKDFASDLSFETIKANIDLLLWTIQNLIMNTISLSPYARARVEMVAWNIWKTIDEFEQSINQCDQWSDEWCEIIFSLWLMCFQVRDDENALLYWKMLAHHTPQSEKQEEWHFLASLNVSMQYYSQWNIIQAVDIREQIAALPDSSSERKQSIITSARTNIQIFYNKFTITPSPFMA
jgi:hypothetical protein